MAELFGRISPDSQSVWMVGEMLGVRNHRRFVLGA